MIVVFYIVVGILTAVQLALDYSVKYIHKDGRTTEHKMVRMLLLIVTLIVVVAGLVKAEEGDRKGQERERQTARYETNLVTEIESLTASNGEMRAQLCDLTKAMSDMLSITVNKPETDLETRGQMLGVKKRLDLGDVCLSDLGALVSAWSNRVSQAKLDSDRGHLKAVEGEVQLLEPCMEVWDYAVRRFEAKLSGYFKVGSKRVSCDYVGIPAAKSLCRSNGGGDTNLCEIVIGDGCDWKCECSLQTEKNVAYIGGNGPEMWTRLVLSSNWGKGDASLKVFVNSGGVSCSVQGGTEVRKRTAIFLITRR